jgi:putative hydrolase of the HAD superfamily
MQNLTTIGFDADDTLWQNERFFKLTETRLRELLAEYAEQDHLAERLLDAERRNLHRYGYGIKGFTLSMIETALEVTDNQAPATVIRAILEAGQEMLAHPVETLPGVPDALEALAGRHRLILITKGDLFDQERKLAASGLGEMFSAVEIVSEKDEQAYRRIFAEHGTGPEAALMAGNSLKSDVVPSIRAGAWGVHIPHELTWALEHVEAPIDAPRFRAIDSIAALPDLVAGLG